MNWNYIQKCSSDESTGVTHKECQLPVHRNTSTFDESCSRSVNTFQHCLPTIWHVQTCTLTCTNYGDNMTN